ncbi:EAL domain-containing protein [Aquincola tertiaricarbonis]|uniref:EAL domain-containing protein n=1 Tax=Aquincola tertiaricarbonis TaxID=391953 RepID=A0ABY4S9H6_AQUTE|nr:EAL domain-containing protein [Aquincola tertiaricarbonis]URI10006.1 EAL domain-containing protein [Aquincola tertiaricarbonis]
MSLRYDTSVVALSYLIATLASFVALDLAHRVRGGDRAMAFAWWFGGSLAMGTGIWSMHFVGMQALQLPVEVGYDLHWTVVSWVAGVLSSAIALGIATRAQLRWTTLSGGALSIGLGISAMHYIGMAALRMAPGIVWHRPTVVASVAVAVVASAAALLIFFWLRRFTRMAARAGQLAAALVMGAAICGMHYTGMAAASFPAGAVCLSVDGLRGDGLGVMVSVAAAVLLSLTLCTSILDAQLQGRAQKLAQSLQAANEELHQLAFRDALTGLPNRLLFDDRVTQAVERRQRHGSRLAVLFVDLDGFKPINDSFGHGFGDQVLQEMARRLAATARATDTVARVGGDEFVLLLESDVNETAIAQLAQRLIQALSLPVRLQEREVSLSCSVGIALDTDGTVAAKLMAHADSAMYAAKRAGGSSFAFFEPHMDAHVREQVELQRDLRLALERGELELHYQPKVSGDGRTITGAEALARWRHPQRGLVSPAVFIPIAERFGLIGALGDWVIQQACTQVRQWLGQGLRVRVAINLSVHQLRQDDLVQRVQGAIDQHRIDPTLLTFEITESVAMEDAEGTLRTFERLSAIGVHLSIDDFGTGYSSLSYLRRLQAGQLKIDRAFVRDLESSADARAIVEAVVRLAHALGLKVVAEGVETAGQRDVLHALGCDELQGFLFARPMQPHLMALWAQGEGRPTALDFRESAYVPEDEAASLESRA